MNYETRRLVDTRTSLAASPLYLSELLSRIEVKMKRSEGEVYDAGTHHLLQDFKVEPFMQEQCKNGPKFGAGS